jgi:hypothetical protein
MRVVAVKGGGVRLSVQSMLQNVERFKRDTRHTYQQFPCPVDGDAPKLLLTSAAGYTRLLWPLHGIIDQSLIEMFPGAEKSHIARTLGYSSVRPAKRTVSWGSGM